MSTRTLVIHTGGIGDFLLACPAIEALGADAPVEMAGNEERLELAVTGGIAQRAHALDAIGFGSLFSAPSRRLTDFVARFNRAVVWMRDDDGAIERGLRRAGLGRSGVGGEVLVHPGLPPEGWKEHASAYYRRCVGASGSAEFRLRVVGAKDDVDVVIHPGSGSPKKNWPIECFIAIALRLEQAGARVGWSLGPAEEESLRGRMGETCGLGKLIEVQRLAELAGVLKGARLYVGNDSGITHLAAAVGCPTVAVFGPTDPGVWAPLGTHVHVAAGAPWPATEAVLKAALQILGT